MIRLMQYKGAYFKSSVLSVAMCGGSFKDPEANTRFGAVSVEIYLTDYE